MAAHTYLLAIALLICGVGDAEIETQRDARATGSSVLLPGLRNGTEFKENMIYELRKVGASPGWLMMYHGAPKVHKFYETRGQFFPENKSFLLTNLTKEDSGVYEQKMNQKTQLRVELTVKDPVEEPVLRRQEDDNGTCRITLLCAGWKGDTWKTTFSRDGEEIIRNQSGDTLEIDGTDPQQWGIYTCTVTNLVSQRGSQELALIPEELTGASLFFYFSLIGGIGYICHLLCLVFSCKHNISPHVKDAIFYSKCVCGAIMELIAFSIILHLFHDPRDQLSRVVVNVSVISVVLLVRVLWSLMLCGVPLPSMIISVMEDVLLAADVLLVPAVFIQYVCLYSQATDLCGKRRDPGVMALFYLVIGFVVLLAVALPLRILYVTYRASDTPDPPDPEKGQFIPADNTNDDGRRKEQPEKEALTVEETPT